MCRFSTFLFIASLLQSSSCFKYEFMAIKSTDELPTHIPNNVRFVDEKLRINSIENNPTFLTIIKSNSIPFIMRFKNNETSKSCISEFEMQFGGNYNVKVIVSCQQRWSKLVAESKNQQIVKPDENECYADVTINSTSAVLSYSGEKKEIKLDKFYAEENVGINSSIISFAIFVTVTNDDDSTCSPYVEFEKDHNLAVLHPAQETITTTTTSTTKKPTTVSNVAKPSKQQHVDKTSENGLILWILVFVFSGTFAAAFGGVGMFFFLGYREKRIQKNKFRLSGDDEMNTAKEHQTPPKRLKSAPPKSVKTAPPSTTPSKTITTTTRTAKSQLSKK